MTTLRRALQEYYESEALRPAVLERLVSRAMTRPKDRSRRIVPWLAAAAALVIAAGLLVARIGLLGRTEQGPLSRAVAEEISANHHKNLEPEFRSADLPALAVAMDRLDFSLVEPDRLREERLRVIGGRYCSLQGQAAAQIQLADESGRRCTLYEVPSVRALSFVSPGAVELSGIQVILWRERGLLFGLARPTGGPSTPRR